ncbi:MAG: hypothetical protein ACOYEJ_00975 [Mahellales bacterium]|jgi:hypothetical protein
MLLGKWIKKIGAFSMNNIRDDNFADIDELLNSRPFVTAPDGFTSRVMANIPITSNRDYPYKHQDTVWGISLIAAGCLILMLTLTPMGHLTINAADNNTRPFMSITKPMEMVYAEFNKITHWLSRPIQNIQNINLGGEHLEL